MPAAVVSSVQGPWARVVDRARAGQSTPDTLRDLVDGVIQPDGSVASRPGVQQLATHPGAPGQAQGIAGMELAGTVWTLAVVGGVLASYDWDADAWAVLTHTGATISATGPVALVPFFDQLIVSDGINRPWATTLGSGIGTYLGCATGPWYGVPVVKDAKLFGIKADERRVIVWSEEADATLGGEAGGYNNAWDLRQTSQAALVSLRASNASLVYQRERATGQILGSVNADFQASGTHDDLADDRGTLAPFASVLTDGGVLWAVDALGRPYRVRTGNAPDDLWLRCQATVGTVNRGRLAAAWGLMVPDLDAVVFALPRTTDSAHNTDLLCFDRATGDYTGRWALPGADWAAGALASDADGIERLIVLSHAGAAYVVWRQAEADADAACALDTTTAGGAALVPTRVVLGDAAAEGGDQAVWIQWRELTLELGDPRVGSVPPVLAATNGGTTVTVDVETPGHAFGSATRTTTVGPNGRKDLGYARHGRWIRTAVSAAAGAGTQRFVLRRATWLGSVRDTNANRR